MSQTDSADAAAAPAVTAPDWARIRFDYEGGNGSIVAISERHGITPSALKWRAKRDLWRKSYASAVIDRPTIITRMFRLLERQIVEFDASMQTVTDKEANLLGTMAKTLEKLIDIDTAQQAQKGSKTPAQDMAAIRAKLARRIEELMQSR